VLIHFGLSIVTHFRILQVIEHAYLPCILICLTIYLRFGLSSHPNNSK
jgi:hypothetical protein